MIRRIQRNAERRNRAAAPKVSPLNLPRAPLGTPIRVIPAAKSVSFDELMAYAQGVCRAADPLGVLLALSARAHEAFSTDPAGHGSSVGAHTYGLAILALCGGCGAAIEASTVGDAGTQEARAADALLRSACGLANADLLASTTMGQRQLHLDRTMLETAIHQPALQVDVGQELGRMRILLGLEPIGGATIVDVRDHGVDALARHKYGQTADEVALLAFMAFTGATKWSGFVPAATDASLPEVRALLDRLGMYAAQNSLRARDTAKKLRTAAAYRRLEALPAEIFARHPFIAVGKDRFIPAPIPYLAHRTGMAYVHDLLGVAARYYGRKGELQENNPFTNSLGQRFEAYVAALLRDAAGDDAVAEFYFDRGGRKSPDVILFDRNGEDAVIIECKVARLPRDAYYGLDMASWRRVLDEKLVEPITQAGSAIAAILECASRTGEAEEGARQVAARLLARKRWHFVAMYAQLPAIHMLPMVRTRVENAARAASEADASHRALWTDPATRPRIGVTIPMAVADLELAITCGHGRDLGRMLHKIWCGADSSIWLVGDGMGTPTLRNLILRFADDEQLLSLATGGSRQPRRLPARLSAAFEAWRARVKDDFDALTRIDARADDA